ncbi:MAG TPA: hypothetical protein VFM88_11225 [Vicinamibacteria bacterium]|nr:hypothetical protein [Vicinamibacteria bacterium]
MSEPSAGFPLSAETPQEAGEQQAAPGLSPRQHRVASLLTRLAATARSFLLYDPHNETIQRFITKLLLELSAALEEEGPLTLEVLPLEIAFENAPVYVNRDRERSLAFRLYRDGVRQLSFRPGFSPDELARLLEVLSIRYTGINQREEDVVTLLWKARFRHLDVVSVEGIVPEDDAASGAAPAEPDPGLRLPDDVDLPRPELPMPQAPSWVAVSPERAAALLAEADATRIPDDCLALIGRLRRELDDPTARMAFEEVSHLFIEVRDFLLNEDHLPALKRFISLLWDMAGAEEPPWDQARHAALYELLDSCGDRRAVRRVLHSVPFDQRKLSPTLVEVLDRACPDSLAAVLDVLEVETGPAVRAVARQLIEHYGTRRLTMIEERFHGSSGETASDLLRVLANMGGEEAPAFIARQASHPDKAVQDEALWHLETMEYSGAVGRAYFDAFKVTDLTRRARVLGMIARTGDRRFVDLLSGFLEEHGASLAPGEAAQIGQVLGALAGDQGVARFAAWLTPGGLLRKTLPGVPAQQIAAAMALAESQGDAAGAALEAALGVAEPEVYDWILGALGQRERNRSGR